MTYYRIVNVRVSTTDGCCFVRFGRSNGRARTFRDPTTSSLNRVAATCRPTFFRTGRAADRGYVNPLARGWSWWETAWRIPE